MALIVAALVVLAAELETESGSDLARIASGAAIASLASTAALQAVDGIALKFMVDTWAAAEAPEKVSLFHATLGVRQVEVGPASVVSILFGITVALYGITMWNSPNYARWVAILALVGGVPTALAGVLMAYSGFSSLAMSVNMPSSFLLLVWIMSVGVLMWRHERNAPVQ